MSAAGPVTADASDGDLTRALREGWLGGMPPRYALVRFALLRGLGLIYSVAFLIAYQQGPGLIGSRGLLPAERFVSRIQHGGAFLQYPTLFYWNASDGVLQLASACGLALS